MNQLESMLPQSGDMTRFQQGVPIAARNSNSRQETSSIKHQHDQVQLHCACNISKSLTNRLQARSAFRGVTRGEVTDRKWVAALSVFSSLSRNSIAYDPTYHSTRLSQKSDRTSVYMKHRIPRPLPSHDDIHRCALQHRTKDPIMTRNPG